MLCREKNTACKGYEDWSVMRRPTVAVVVVVVKQQQPWEKFVATSDSAYCAESDDRYRFASASSCCEQSPVDRGRQFHFAVVAWFACRRDFVWVVLEHLAVVVASVAVYLLSVWGTMVVCWK